MSYQTRRDQRIKQLIEAAVNRIESHIQLTEVGTPGIKIGIDDFMKSNPDQLAKIATKTDVNVVDQVKEADESNISDLIDISDDLIIQGKKAYVYITTASPGDEVEFTTPKGKVYTASVSDSPKENKYLLKNIQPKKNIVPKETPQEKQIESTQQEDAIYNLKNWAQQLQIPIGDGELTSNEAIKFGYFSSESQQQISILVLSNGLIKMSGHSVFDFSDFKNIVNFHSDNK